MTEENPNLPSIHNLAAHGNINKINQLLDDGADIEIPDRNGDRALHIAAAHDNAMTAFALVKAGAKLDARNNGDETPLDVAIARHGEGSVTALFLKGAMERKPKTNQEIADVLLRHLD